jgi:hypothetical protein
VLKAVLIVIGRAAYWFQIFGSDAALITLFVS